MSLFARICLLVGGFFGYWLSLGLYDLSIKQDRIDRSFTAAMVGVTGILAIIRAVQKN